MPIVAGPQPSRIAIVDYDPAWPTAFEAERARLEPVFGDVATAIEHIGSTAVHGLAAKPTIDIAVELYDIGFLAGRVGALEALGYGYDGDVFLEGRHDLHKPPEATTFHGRTHALHVYEVAHPDFVDVITFRDYLRAHHRVARDYAALKRSLAAGGLDGMRYTAAKTEFIERCLRHAYGGPGGDPA
jgi:GrpB-like predicted nucleotidyltransferase (UPF0157 family)